MSSSLLVALLGCTFALVEGQQCDLVPLPSAEKQVYKLGVLANRGIETAYNEFNGTARYLTESIGYDFEPPITFEIAPVPFGSIDVVDRFVTGDFDFVMANPSISSCIDSEIGTSSLASMISTRTSNSQSYELSQFGGVIFTRASNDEINTIYDLVDTVVACISLTGLGR